MPILDLTKTHSIHGAGSGKDVVFQIGQDGQPYIYDRTGTVLEMDTKSLSERGLTLTDEIRLLIAASKAEVEVREADKRIQRAIEAAKAREMANIQAGKPFGYDEDEDVFEDEEEFVNPLEDLD